MAEGTAASPPLNATVVALDTLRKEVQMTEEFRREAFENRGIERPEKPNVNELWYLSLGYEVMPGPSHHSFPHPVTGELETVPIINFKKSISLDS